MNVQDRRMQIDRLRSIPLAAVLRAAGAQADRRDPVKWHTAHGVLSVNGVKFIPWKQGRGGGGAIDLAMYLNATDFRGAVRWLAQRFPISESLKAKPPPLQPRLTLPPAAAGQIGRVRRYLIEQRHLPHTLLEPLIQAGKLYADRRANAVFLLLGTDHRAVGAELRGIRGVAWHGLAPGSRKDLGYFSTGPIQAQKAVLCESAIDAISCAALYPDCLCLSTAGARPNPAWLGPLLAQGYHLSCAFDADSTGDSMAEAMTILHPSIQRLRPPLHDWNDVLQAST